MELKIYNPQDNAFLQKIEWNFDDLKREITESSEIYRTSIYTDDNIKLAKEDRSKLNKFIDALESKRKDIKKQIMVPYDAFETEEKQLVSIVNQAVQNIDSQVKAFEEKQRTEKLEKVKKIYEECIGDLKRTLPFEQLFKSQYTNASTTLKSIKDEMVATITKVDQELKIINSDTGRYVFEMKEAYLRNFDMVEALNVKQQLEEAAERKAAFEQARKEQEAKREKEQQEKAQAVISAGAATVGKSESKEIPKKQQEEPRENTVTIDFRVTGTARQFAELKQFLSVNKMAYGPVPREGK